MTLSSAELASSGLHLHIDDAVATVTLDRPERRNAMTPGIWHGLAAIGASLPGRGPGRRGARRRAVLLGRHRSAHVHTGGRAGGGACPARG